jgi:hypothetical protein
MIMRFCAVASGAADKMHSAMSSAALNLEKQDAKSRQVRSMARHSRTMPRNRNLARARILAFDPLIALKPIQTLSPPIRNFNVSFPPNFLYRGAANGIFPGRLQ